MAGRVRRAPLRAATIFEEVLSFGNCTLLSIERTTCSVQNITSAQSNVKPLVSTVDPVFDLTLLKNGARIRKAASAQQRATAYLNSRGCTKMGLSSNAQSTYRGIYIEGSGAGREDSHEV